MSLWIGQVGPSVSLSWIWQVLTIRWWFKNVTNGRPLFGPATATSSSRSSLLASQMLQLDSSNTSTRSSLRSSRSLLLCIWTKFGFTPRTPANHTWKPYARSWNISKKTVFLPIWRSVGSTRMKSGFLILWYRPKEWGWRKKRWKLSKPDWKLNQ